MRKGKDEQIFEREKGRKRVHRNGVQEAAVKHSNQPKPPNEYISQFKKDALLLLSHIPHHKDIFAP